SGGAGGVRPGRRTGPGEQGDAEPARLGAPRPRRFPPRRGRCRARGRPRLAVRRRALHARRDAGPSGRQRSGRAPLRPCDRAARLQGWRLLRPGCRAGEDGPDPGRDRGHRARLRAGLRAGLRGARSRARRIEDRHSRGGFDAVKRPVTTATIVAAALALGNFLAVRASAAGTREIIGWAPLHLAAAIGHAPTVRALLAVGANPEVKSLDNRTPLFVAAKRGRVEAVCALLEG